MIVKWRDSRRIRGEMFEPKDLKDAPLAILETIGFGVKFDNKIVLASEYYPEDEDQLEGYRELYTIPKVCVLQIKYLKEQE